MAPTKFEDSHSVDEREFWAQEKLPNISFEIERFAENDPPSDCVQRFLIERFETDTRI